MDFDRLIALALGELDPADEAAADEHLLACSDCTATVERLHELRAATGDLIRQGAVAFAGAGALIDMLEADGLISRSYRVAPGQSAPCSVGAGDVYAAAHLEVDLTGVQRVDLEQITAGETLRVDDIPFDAARGTISLLTPSALLRTFPSMHFMLRLIAVDAGGERVLGEYRLDHTAFRG